VAAAEANGGACIRACLTLCNHSRWEIRSQLRGFSIVAEAGTTVGTGVSILRSLMRISLMTLFLVRNDLSICDAPRKLGFTTITLTLTPRFRI
jgi:hypothetical protein